MRWVLFFETHELPRAPAGPRQRPRVLAGLREILRVSVRLRVFPQASEKLSRAPAAVDFQIKNKLALVVVIYFVYHLPDISS